MRCRKLCSFRIRFEEGGVPAIVCLGSCSNGSASWVEGDESVPAHSSATGLRRDDLRSSGVVTVKVNGKIPFPDAC